MSTGLRALLILISTVAVITIWMTRYSATPSNTEAGIWVVDRWIGRVYYCLHACTRHYPPTQEEQPPAPAK